MLHVNQFHKSLSFLYWKENVNCTAVPPDSFSDKCMVHRLQTCLVTPRSALRNPHGSLLHLEAARAFREMQAYLYVHTSYVL